MDILLEWLWKIIIRRSAKDTCTNKNKSNRRGDLYNGKGGNMNGKNKNKKNKVSTIIY